MSEDIEKIIDEISTYFVHNCGATYLFLLDGKVSIKQSLYHYTTLDQIVTKVYTKGISNMSLENFFEYFNSTNSDLNYMLDRP